MYQSLKSIKDQCLIQMPVNNNFSFVEAEKKFHFSGFHFII